MLIRRLLGLILLFIMIPAWALTPVKVVLDWYINPDHAPLLLAQAKGYFKEQGLDVTFIPPGNVSASQLVAAGKADIGVYYQSYLLTDVNNGVPIVRFATLMNHPLSCMAVLASSNIKNLPDLAGKTIGYSGGDFSVALLKTMLLKAGVDPSSINMVNVNMDLTQALLSKRIDAATDLMRNVEPVELAAMGAPTRLFLPEKYGVPPYDELIFIVNKNQVKNPMLPKFLAALREAVTRLQAKPEESWQLVSKTYHSELAATAAMAATNHKIWLATVPYFAAQPDKLNAARYQIFTAYLYKQGLIKNNLPLGDYAVQILPAVGS